jgi:hypothetical protein
MIFWIIPSACCFSIRLSMFVQLLAQETVFLIVDFDILPIPTIRKQYQDNTKTAF